MYIAKPTPELNEKMIFFLLGKNYSKTYLGDKKCKSSYKLYNDSMEIIFHKRRFTVLDKSRVEPKLYQNLEIAFNHMSRSLHQSQEGGGWRQAQ